MPCCVGRTWVSGPGPAGGGRSGCGRAGCAGAAGLSPLGSAPGLAQDRLLLVLVAWMSWESDPVFSGCVGPG